MGTRARLSATIGAVIMACAALGASQAAAAPDPSAAIETVAADKKETTSTPVPSAIGDDLIYDILGPTVSDGAKPQRAGERSYTAGHFLMQVDGEP